MWLGTSALDLGAISMFWYCFRERETILDLFEMSSGQRMHTRYFQVGGVIEDIPRRLRREGARVHATMMPERVDQYEALLDKNEIVLQRLRGVCPLDEETLLGLGVTGPLLRADRQPVGPAQGRRRTRPTTTSTSRSRSAPIGDNYDRFRVRIAEMRESVKIIEQALDGLPEGPYITEDRKVALPPRHELATSMEALIHHFKLVTEGFRVPPGEVYYPIESPRGELGCFVRSDGSSKPARVHMRDPSFVNLQAFAPMVKDAYIADLIATLAMLDPILGGHRPVSADVDAATSRSALRARLARPGLGRRRRPRRRTRRRSPTRRRRRCPTELRARDRGADGASTRTAARRRSRRCAAVQRAARLVLARGDRAGRVRDAADARPT